MKSKRLFTILILSLGLTLALATTALADDITVDTAEDELNTDGDCSLREAIAAANTNATVDACTHSGAPGADTVYFDSVLSGQTITLTYGSQLAIADELTIDGSTLAVPVTISGDVNENGVGDSGDVRVFQVNAGFTATMDSLIITKGYAAWGAGISSIDAMLTLINCTISDNLTPSNTDGGGTYGSTITVIDSTYSNNSAARGTGALYSSYATIMNSTFSGNQAIAGGVGAVQVTYALTVTNSTFVGNSGNGSAGAIQSVRDTTISNCIFSGNSAGGASSDGGAIYLPSFSTTANLTNNTFSGNSAGRDGGAIYSFRATATLINNTFSGDSAVRYGDTLNHVSAGEVMTLTNTIVANVPGADNCYGTIVNGGHNLDSGTTCGWGSSNGSLSSTDPLFVDADGADNTVGTLDDDLHLQSHSPAIDAGDSSAVPAGITTDLDGDPRIMGPAVDMGAYEHEPPDLGIVKAVTPATAVPGQAITYTLTFSNSGETIATDVVITDRIPVSITVQGVISTGITITDSGTSPAYVWTVANLREGWGGIITITGVLSDPLTAGTFANRVTITATLDDDSGNNSSEAGVAVQNSAPVATDNEYTTDEDVPANGNVLDDDTSDGVDSDANGDPLTAVLDSAVATGTLVLGSDGSFTYTPTLNYNGVVTFSYHASDTISDSNTALVTITVNSVNDLPVATDNEYTTDEDVPASGNVLTDDTGDGVDSDVDGDPLTAVLDSTVATGTLVLGSDGSFTYTPTLDYNGVVTFSYHASDTISDSNTALVTITVNAVNDAPVATDNEYTTDEDVPASGNVLSDDTGDGVDGDVDSDPLTAVLDSTVATGTLVLGSDGSFTYTPTLDYNGVVTFSYHASDTISDSNTALVTITVNAVNDSPVADGDTFTVDEDSSDNALDVLDGDTDVDGDTLTVDAVGDPPNGTATDNDTNVLYTPDADFFGTDMFTYTVSDGNGGYDTATVTVTVVSIEEPVLRLFKSVDTGGLDPVPLGSVVTYTIVVSNSGDGAASGLVITDPLPAGLDYGTQIDGGTVILPQGNLLSWGPAYIPSQSEHVITFTATVTDNVAFAEQDMVNTAYFTATNHVPGASNSVTFTVAAAPCNNVTDVTLDVQPGTLQIDNAIAFSADIVPDNATMPYNYTIDYGDGTTPVTGSSSDDPLALSHTYTSTGTFDVTIYVWNCSGTVGDAVSDTLQVEIESGGFFIYLPLVAKNSGG